MLSTLDHIDVKLQERWVPKWHGAFRDSLNGGFYERLNYQFAPLDMGYKRLVTQCRQLSIYAHAASITGHSHIKNDLSVHFSFLKQHYYNPTSQGWVFSCADNGDVKDGHYDLYAHGFVLFALSHYYNATNDNECRDLAMKTAAFILREFKMPDGLPGYAEALDDQLNIIPRMRRQNPHMHLFEGALFAYRVWQDPMFKTIADEIYALFSNYFFDAETGTLGEFYDDHLRPHVQEGHICEPGHHYEWVWLLHLYGQLFGDTDQLKLQRRALFLWAESHGYDNDYNGIYNSLDRQGNVIDDHKRIWPLTEALKAHLCMLGDATGDKERQAYKKILMKVVAVLSGGYLQERGFWTEIMDRRLLPETDYMPGTTPYHLYFGITESVRLSKERGQSKSWAAYPYKLHFKARRSLSHWTQKLFKAA